MFRQPDLTPIPKNLDLRCETVKRGTTFLGVVIGPMVKVMTHTFNGQSKPCLRFATEGKLKCACAKTDYSLRAVGYLPVMLRDGDRVAVILSAVNAYQLSGVKQGTVVNFYRPDKPKSKIRHAIVTGTDTDQLWIKEAKKLPPIDIMEYLCHLWQIHPLTRHLGFTPRRSLACDAAHPLVNDPFAPRFVEPINPPADAPPPEAEAA